MTPRRLATCVVLAAVVSSVAATGWADDGDPPHVPWTEVLPPVPGDQGGQTDVCRGRRPCLDQVIRSLDRRLERAARRCDHEAPYLVAYLRLSQELQRTIRTGPYFDDPDFIIDHDLLFARYYFDNADAWRSGNRERVAPAWLLAFDAAADRRVSGLGNMMLGISAHVNRDLPFVLEEVGLVAPDGTSRKSDEDRINEILARAIRPVIEEAAARFDPTIDDIVVPGVPVTETFILQGLYAWREQAFRHAEALVNAPDPGARALVVAEIEEFALREGQSMEAMTRYDGPGAVFGTAAERDAFCARHG